jgi:DNA-binding response OmpR family regulator
METNLRKAILIVEDNPGDQLLLTELLTSSALSFNQLIYSSTIASAKQVLEENEVDVILLDLSLPDSSGLGSFFSLKPYTYEIPVIILSGLTDTELALKAISEGAQDYLVKDDFDERLLVKTIQYSIERKKSLAALRTSNDRYNLVSKATNDMVWDWNLKTGSVYRNAEQFERIVKLPINQKDQSGDYWLSHFHPDDKDILSQLMEDINKDINKNNFEMVINNTFT